MSDVLVFFIGCGFASFFFDEIVPIFDFLDQFAGMDSDIRGIEKLGAKINYILNRGSFEEKEPELEKYLRSQTRRPSVICRWKS